MPSYTEEIEMRNLYYIPFTLFEHKFTLYVLHFIQFSNVLHGMNITRKYFT